MVHTAAGTVGAPALLGAGVVPPACFGDGVGVPAFVDVGVPTFVVVGVGVDGSPLVLPKHTDISTSAACEDKPDKVIYNYVWCSIEGGT